MNASRWDTFPEQHLVLCIARTFTSAVALLEALEVFRGDPRIQTAFTVDSTSAFSGGVARLLRRRGVRLHPWEEVRRLAPRLVLTASENVDLTGFEAPVVVLPHGIGFNKYVPDSRSKERRLSGVPRPEFWDRPNLRLVLSHPDQRVQLRAAGLHRLARGAEVVGGLGYDRLQASRRLRGRYRDRLGIAEHQKLVLVTSTWGPAGLLGSRPDLPARLLADLPWDDYRVAAVLHPNIWFRHSSWQVRHVLGDALDAGLALVPPDAGWGASLVAADCVIGDHGSVTLYGAAMDRPLLLGSFGGTEAVPGTPIARLAELADPLDSAGALEPQIAAAVAKHSPGRYAELAAHSFAYPGEARQRLAALLYRELGLPPLRRRDGARTLPPPEPEYSAPDVFEVHTRILGSDTVAAERFPAAVRPPDDPPAGFRHRAAAANCAEDALAHSASVVYRPAPQAPRPREWVQTALADYPGALIAAAATPGGCLTAIRGAGTISVRAPDTIGTCLQAAVVYTLHRAGRELRGTYLLRAGSSQRACTLSPA